MQTRSDSDGGVCLSRNGSVSISVQDEKTKRRKTKKKGNIPGVTFLKLSGTLFRSLPCTILLHEKGILVTRYHMRFIIPVQGLPNGFFTFPLAIFSLMKNQTGMGSRREIRCVIVEDEALARELLVSYTVSRPELKLIGIAKNGEEALEMMKNLEFDLAFLDIDLPGMSAFEILEHLDKLPYIIFTTGSRDRAVEAFDIGAVDYIVKPIPRERFAQAVERALSFFQKEETSPGKERRHGLFISEKENHYLVAFDDIIYAASHENYCSIHAIQRDYVTYSSLKQMEARLPADHFLRIYKQFIINVNKIQKIQSDQNGNYTVYLNDEDETRLPVGRAYLTRLKELLS